MDMTSFSFLTAGCAVCHPGGGSAEYDREGKRYDRWMSDPASGFTPGGDNDFDGDYYKAKWSLSGVLEADCLLCHLPEYDFKARKKQLGAMNFRWAPSAGAGLAKISGAVAENASVKITYDVSRFNEDGTLSPHIVSEPRNETCLACHAKPGWKKRGANFRPRTDVHLRAGMRCVDCHASGSHAVDERIRGKEVHQFGKGDDPGGHVRDDLDNTMRSCADCHTSGYLGAPVAKHRGLPPLHLDKIACQTCHIPERAVKAAHTVASDVFNPGAKIPTKGKHLWTFYGPDMAYWNHYGDLEMMGYDDKPTAPYRPVLVRYDGKIHPVNRIHSTWPAIETEGKEGLQQPKMGNVYKMWAAHRQDPSAYPSLSRIVDDNGDGVIEVNRPEEIDALIAAIGEMLEKTGYPMQGKRVVWVMNDRVYRSGNDYREIPMHSWEASPYANVHKYTHDVYPARAALGSNGCTDCHSPESDFFFAGVTKYPFGEQAQPLIQPQYAVLGLSGPMVRLGAWRESYLKPLIYALLLVLAVVLCVLICQVAMEWFRKDLHLPAWVRFAPVLVGAYALTVAVYLHLQSGLPEYALPLRFWLDSSHLLSALFILILGAVAFAWRIHRLPRQSSGKKHLLTSRTIYLLIAAFLVVGFAGSFMLVKHPALESVARLSYTAFDLALALLLIAVIGVVAREIVYLYSNGKEQVHAEN